MSKIVNRTTAKKKSPIFGIFDFISITPLLCILKLAFDSNGEHESAVIWFSKIFYE